MIKSAIASVFLLFFSIPAVAAAGAAAALPPEDGVFLNPTKLSPLEACAAENINAERFAQGHRGAEYSAKDKIKICKGVDTFLKHSRLAYAGADAALAGRLRALWGNFIDYGVRFIPLPKKMEKDVFVAAAAFPRKYRAEKFQAAVYVPAARAGEAFFFYAFWHELQHVYDIRRAWQDYGSVTNYELEFNGFYLSSLLSEVYRLNLPQTGGKPIFWKEEWKSLAPDRRHALRAEAIDLYIRASPVLKDAWNKNRADYDYSGQKKEGGETPPTTPSPPVPTAN